jgi:hypothetical protein
MPPIVWHVFVPGTQSVTLVKAPLKYVLAGPALTMRAWVFTGDALLGEPQ